MSGTEVWGRPIKPGLLHKKRPRAGRVQTSVRVFMASSRCSILSPSVFQQATWRCANHAGRLDSWGRPIRPRVDPPPQRRRCHPLPSWSSTCYTQMPCPPLQPDMVCNIEELVLGKKLTGARNRQGQCRPGAAPSPAVHPAADGGRCRPAQAESAALESCSEDDVDLERVQEVLSLLTNQDLRPAEQAGRGTAGARSAVAG